MEQRDADSGILSLPAEVVEHILSESCLKCSDIFNIALTCSRLRVISNSNEIWKEKLLQRWPDLFACYNGKAHCAITWKDEYQAQVQHIRQVGSILEQISRTSYNKDHVSEEEYEELCQLLSQHPMSHWFFVNALRNLLLNGNSQGDLTQRYYGKAALLHLQQKQLTKEWKEYLELPDEQQTMENGVVMLAGWFQSTEIIRLTDICAQLDDIANMVISELKDKSPRHPLANKTGDHSDLAVHGHDSRIALETLNYVLFEKLRFHGNLNNYYNPHNSFINKVLELRTGIPISLCILYSTVARRLGVHCQVVNFPGHCILRWQEHPNLDSPSEKYTYIDCFEKGTFLTQHECSSLAHGSHDRNVDATFFHPCTTREVFQRMAANMINIGRQNVSQSPGHGGLYLLVQSLELYLLLNPKDLQQVIFLTRLYLDLGINHKKSLELLRRVDMSINPEENWSQHQFLKILVTQVKEQQSESESQAANTIVPKKRGDQEEEFGPMKYSVGMIMKHRSYQYTCVIVGWDHRCKASQGWIIQMGVNLLSKREHQPFYNVLVEDGSNRYAAEENLKPAPEAIDISHPDIGKHFQAFCGTHYALNAPSREHHPEDEDHTRRQAAEIYADTADNS